MPETNKRKKILIVDDHPLLRGGMESLLKVETDFEICGEAGTVRDALDRVERTGPDLVVTDLSLPDRNGLELIKDLKALHPKLPVLVVSMHDESVYADRALRAGARGYIMKEAALDRIAEAIRKVLEGEIYVSDAMTRRILKTLSLGGSVSSLKSLSDRELEVFELIGHGKGTREIAEQLHISPRTVNAHRGHIREKLGLQNGGDLRVRATKWVESGGREEFE